MLALTSALVIALGLNAPSEIVVGLPCEECDAVFDGMPAKLGATARIAPSDEPGTPMVLDGTVRDRAGKPAAGIVIYAYHTDASGRYPRGTGSSEARRHGRLRGWAKTDTAGHYRFDTIRPAGYPGRKDPEHVHMHVLEPGRCTYYIDDVRFEDDPRQKALQERPDASSRGGDGLVMPRRDDAGVWHATRDIALGAGISDYERCSKNGRASM
jgi:protocatechuate 3,4-dioxygenase beta subunit